MIDRPLDRSVGVTSTLTLPLTASRSRTALDFDALYRSARDDVFAYALTLLRDRSAAEEVTAQAFEKAYRKSRTYDDRKGSARGWLFGIARNAALDELRRQKRVAALAAEPADLHGSTADEAEALLRRAAVRAAMAALPPRDREIVALKFHAGLENTEIADVLGVSLSNAGTLLHRAITKLREALDDNR